jgi:hypothetical protein
MRLAEWEREIREECLGFSGREDERGTGAEVCFKPSQKREREALL